MILYINACVREESRTKQLADFYLAQRGGSVTKLDLAEQDFPRSDASFLQWRDEGITKGEYSDPIFAFAKAFAAAEEIVIAAPYWDLSFPATLKQYVEQINVLGLTFTYTPEGTPKGLCRANRLVYLTTAGGSIVSDAYGYGYIKALAQTFYGIPEVVCFRAEGLDLVGADVEEILSGTRERIFAFCNKNKRVD